jgi:hypothetical protein
MYLIHTYCLLLYFGNYSRRRRKGAYILAEDTPLCVCVCVCVCVDAAAPDKSSDTGEQRGNR